MKQTRLKTVLLLVISFSLFNCSKANPTIDFTKAAEHTVHAVVHIQCEYSQQTIFYEDFFGFLSPQLRNRTYQTSGSGVIIREDGIIITNNHVVQDADKIMVTLNDKRRFEAKLIGNDPSADLAVLKIEAKKLPIIEFGDSDKAKIGEWVLAVGNPFNLTSTVTAGIISAKARNLNILGKKMADEPLESFIQTDAVVNQGNSGGALVNLEGKLIGINTAIASNTGSYTGYSFAIPSNIAKKITQDLIKYGQTQKAVIGLNIAEVDSRLAEYKHLDHVRGLYIASVVENSASEKAGLKEGDIVTKLDGRNVNSLAELNEILCQMSPGDRIEVEYERNKKRAKKKLTLLNENGDTSIIKPEQNKRYNIHGAELRALSKREMTELGISYGVLVENPGSSVFSSAGIRKGFIILSIDKNPVKNSDLVEIIEKQRGRILIEGFYIHDYRRYYYILEI